MTMFRIGHGYDVHKLVEGRDLYLGGVKIPHTTGLLGHSDADVLIHALCDALLGRAVGGGEGSVDAEGAPSGAERAVSIRTTKSGIERELLHAPSQLFAKPRGVGAVRLFHQFKIQNSEFKIRFVLSRLFEVFGPVDLCKYP